MNEFPLLAERVRTLELQSGTFRQRYETSRSLGDRLAMEEIEKELAELIEVLRQAKQSRDTTQALLWGAVGMSILTTISTLALIAWSVIR